MGYFRVYCVYKHTSPNGKVYIGITKYNPLLRWNNGKGYVNNKYFYNAILKYGWDNFTHEIVCEGLSKEEACEKEVKLIALYKSNNSDYGYNLTSGGEHYIHNEEAKLKISAANLGRLHTEETKQNMREHHPFKGKKMGPHSEETRRKISEAHKRNRERNEDEGLIFLFTIVNK